MYKLLVVLLFLIVPSCAKKQQKKIAEDVRTQIDCMIDDAGNGQEVHAKDIVRAHQEYHAKFTDALQHGVPLHSLSIEERITLFEAKFADIPVPLESKPIKRYFESMTLDAMQYMFGYYSPQTIDELAEFYIQSMELFAWRQTYNFSASERLLIFEKPGLECAVSLRPFDGWRWQHQQTQILLFIEVL